MSIRILLSEDAPLFQSLRLRGLTECPTAFSSSYEEERDTPLPLVAQRLAPKPDSAVIGFFSDVTLVGVIGVHRHGPRKLAHKALVWGMYVAPEHRRKGVGRSLMSKALMHAQHDLGVQVVMLGVNTQNAGAIALYESMGFRTYGTERGFLLVDGISYDECLMRYVISHAA